VVWVCSAGDKEQCEVEALKVAKVRVEETVGVNERPLSDRTDLLYDDVAQFLD
jgi:hypothetical protein